MATVTTFTALKADALSAKHNFGSDTLKVILTTTAPLLSNAVYSDITEIASGNGYTTGGVTATVTSAFPLTLSAVTWTAAGGDIAANRYAILYNDTHVSKPLIAYADSGVSAVIANGSTETYNGTWISA